MALSNRERVDRALHDLAGALAPYVEREMDAHVGASWRRWIDQEWGRKLERRPGGAIAWEAQTLLQTVIKNWNDVFKKTLGHAERALVGELTEVRNRWAHQAAFSYEDTHRALDSAERLLQAIGAGDKAREINAARQDVLRTMFTEQRRVVERRQTTLTLAGAPKAGLTPWREVITPHKDVASGRYAVAEFAADLAQVVRGDAGTEYGDPAEFFRRTFLTDGLSRLLGRAMERLAGKGGDPVVELQTNFGGGKTHSMLALYHMAGHANPAALTGLDQLMARVGIAAPPRARRSVIVGTSWSPSETRREADGTVVRTIWGHLAWELGGPEGYGLVAESDRSGMAPGSDRLVELLKSCGPSLILIDEWVAFVRQLYGKTDTPAGSFESNLTFAQALSEAVKAVPGALLVASLPASDIEIGGEGGQVAFSMLRNTFGRIEASWQPATTEEGFEIVRRRLFEPMTERAAFAARDAVVKAHVDMYREGAAAYPSECAESDYKRRLEAAYPIHPELFDRLNADWGSLDKFQRTRGVLRLMANVISVLWEQGDKGLMIMPGSVPLDDPSMCSRLLDYLPQPWNAIINADVDGEGSRALKIDRENPNLQRYGAARRVARTVFMASAPRHAGPNPGLDDRRVRLGCVQPGESHGTFGDALRRLADEAFFLYVDGNRYWFATQPSVTRLAETRAGEIERAEVWAAVVERLRADRERGPFAAVHVAPDDGAEVPDEAPTRLVVLGPGAAHTSLGESGALPAAEAILTRRGQSPRICRNALLFLAPDERRLGDLEPTVRSWLAWRSIEREAETLELTPFQKRQAVTKREDRDKAVDAGIKEAWVWTLAPRQPDPMRPAIEWEVGKAGGQDALAVRAGKRFENDGLLYLQLGARNLRRTLDDHDLWRGQNHVGVKQVANDLAQYLHLPRLQTRELIADAIRSALSQLVCDQFAYAEGCDDEGGRYEALRTIDAGHVGVLFDDASVLVKPDAALMQQSMANGRPTSETGSATSSEAQAEGVGTTPPSLARRFYGSVEIAPDRLGRDVSQIAQEVVRHLADLTGCRVRMTLEIDVEAPGGIPDAVRGVVGENCATLRFKHHGFEDNA